MTIIEYLCTALIGRCDCCGNVTVTLPVERDGKKYYLCKDCAASSVQVKKKNVAGE